MALSSKWRDGRNGIDGFRTAGAMKALFPRARDLQAILINTSGGLTGGDRIDVIARAGEGSMMTLTTQAAERAYRAQSGHAEVTTTLHVENGAQLNWLPQEMILFDGSALKRRLDVSLAPEGRLLMVEPVVFGRAAMGERLQNVMWQDRIRINRAEQPLYWDAIHVDGNAEQHFARPALGAGAGAMVSLVYVGLDAEAHLEPLRSALPASGGVSLLAPDVLTLRLLSPDSFEMRCVLMPILDRLSKNRLPTSWRL